MDEVPIAQVRAPMDQTLAAGLPAATTLAGTVLPLVGRARVYACGITPYDVTHLGHAATFVWVDTLSRVLHAGGAEVIMCRNVTDVDDVLLAAANRDGSPYDEFAAIQQFYFDRDMTALGVGRPAMEPRAHAYIGQVIALAAGLLDRGAAYERDGQVYFRGPGWPGRRSRTRRRRCGCPPSTGTGRMTRGRMTRSTSRSGSRPGTGSRPGPARGGLAGRAGTPNARRWRCIRSARPSTCRRAGVTCGSRITRTRRAWLRCSLAWPCSPGPGSTSAWSGWPGRRWPSRPATSCSPATCSPGYPAAAVRLLILDRRWDEDWDYDRAGLDAAAVRLERIAAAAGRPGRATAGNGRAAVAAIRAALACDLDVPAALRIAEDDGGPAARALGSLLGLWSPGAGGGSGLPGGRLAVTRARAGCG